MERIGNMKTMDETMALKPEEVAGELGMSPTQIRNLMRLKRFNPPIGYAIKTTGRYRYFIYRPMLDEYLHRSPPQGSGGGPQLVELLNKDMEERKALRELLERVLKEEPWEQGRSLTQG